MKGTGQNRVYTYLILHYLCFEVVLIDLIYSLDILDLKSGSQTFSILLGALVSGLGQSFWVGLESWARTREYQLSSPGTWSHPSRLQPTDACA